MKENEEIDYDGLEALIEFCISGGVDFFVVLGTTGESPAIYPDERLDIIDFIAEKNKGRLPLMIGFSGNFTHNLVTKIKELKDDRIDGLLISSPHYNKPSQEGIIKHYQAAADVSEYPIMLYNVPHRTASNMEASTSLELAKHPKIIGIKEASGDMNQCREIAKKRPSDFLLLSGDDSATEEVIKLGGEGVISVIANAYPASTSESVKQFLKGEAYDSKDFDQAVELSGAEGNPTSIKAALKALNICEPYLRLPMTAPSSALVDKFSQLSIKA